MLHKPGSNEGFGLFRVLVAHGPAVAVAGQVHPILIIQEGEKAMVLLHLRGIDTNVAVLAGQNAVGEQPQAHTVAGQPASHSPVDIGGQVIAAQKDRDDLGFRHVHLLPPARGVPGQQGGHSGESRCHTSQEAGLVQRGGQRFPRRVSGAETQAAQGVGRQIAARIVPIRTAAAIGANGGDD